MVVLLITTMVIFLLPLVVIFLLQEKFNLKKTLKILKAIYFEKL
jgi:drug/metabolite transporter (DMT)-like permease